MINAWKLPVLRFVLSVLAALVLVPAAFAGMIDTDSPASKAPADLERDRVRALLQRPGVARELEAAGIPREEARARVDALTDQEVHALAGRIDALPSAGRFSDFEWIMIIIGVVIIALLL